MLYRDGEARIEGAGRLGKECSVKTLPSGDVVTNFRIGMNPRKRNADGTWEDTGETMWLDCSWYGAAGADFAQEAAVGDVVEFVGHLRVRAFEHQGQQREAKQVTVFAAAVKFRKRDDAQARPGQVQSWGRGGGAPF